MTPELKSVRTEDLPPGFDQPAYRRKLIQEYIDAGVPARNVWAQSFNYDDVLLWINEYPAFGRQAVFLDGRYDQSIPASDFRDRKADGLNIIAPPMQILLTVRNGEIVPSEYAKRVRRAGLDIISWTTERSGRIREEVIPAGGAFYYDTTVNALGSDGDILRQIDVLVQDVGIFGLFSDWPATTTFYANCKDIPALKKDKDKRRDDDGDDDDD
jgi:glycerophosphoryl diester phosphodiesterase